MLVHFPIAMLLAAFALEAGGLVLRRHSLNRAAFGVLLLAVPSVLIGLLTGLLTPEATENGIGIHTSGGLSGYFRGNTVLVHENLAFLLLAASIAWLLVRLFVWGASVERQAACLGVGAVVIALLGLTGYYGGDIVYGPQVQISHLSETQFKTSPSP